MSIHAQRNKLGNWMRRNARAVLAALARSQDETHRALAEELAPMIGASLDRLDPLPPEPRLSFVPGRREPPRDD